MKQVVFPSAHHVGTQFKEDPKPGPGEVRIRVKAFGVNFADIMARMGIYPEAPPFPCVVGYEVSGWIDAIGSDVPQSWKGKEVCALTQFGGYSDCVVTKHVADAHNFIESRQSKGKVVIAVDPSDPVHDMTRFQENSFEPLK
ncbi:hypothetical protein HDU99_003426 [Rhizoclosmatium hyalinum]|nr:hypothetical protein HDU99_003426 [Rhizoclosmatium hyalinum]